MKKIKSEMGAEIDGCGLNRAMFPYGDDSLRVTFVAGKAGFAFNTHHNAVFKVNFGIAPSDFRMPPIIRGFS